MGFRSFIQPLLPAWAGGYVSNPEDGCTPPEVVDPIARLDELLFENSVNGGFHRYGLTTVEDVRLAFRLCAPLPAIISQKAVAFTKGRVVVWNPNTEKPVRGQYKEWDDLFLSPNALQSQRQFFLQGYRYQQKYGYCIIDPTYPAGYSDRPSELRIIPNWAFEADWTGVKPGGKPRAAWFNVFGIREELDVRHLVFIKDPGSDDFDETTGLPFSRVAPHEGEVSNVIAALNSRGSIITDRGGVGLISNTSKDPAGGMPIKEDEQRRLEAFYNKGGILRRQKKLVVTNASVGYTPMTFNVEELGLHPEHIACVKSFCNTYAFPFTALAEGFEAKYSNSSNGRRDFQDTTIDPESMDFFEQLSLGLGMYKQNCEAYMDYSGVASVQASMEEKGKGEQAMSKALQTQWNLGTLTRNEIRDRLGQERVARPEFDKYKWELSAEEESNVNNQNEQADGDANSAN